MILFLDFDGTTHPQPCDLDLEFCRLPRIEHILRLYPKVQVAISSFLRVDQDLETLQSYFSKDIRGRVIGVTPIAEKVGESGFLLATTRHGDILKWIEQNAYTGAWVALDDDVKGFPDPCLQLVACEQLIGFDDGAEVKLRDYLDRHFA